MSIQNFKIIQMQLILGLVFIHRAVLPYKIEKIYEMIQFGILHYNINCKLKLKVKTNRF